MSTTNSCSSKTSVKTQVPVKTQAPVKTQVPIKTHHSCLQNDDGIKKILNQLNKPMDEFVQQEDIMNKFTVYPSESGLQEIYTILQKRICQILRIQHFDYNLDRQIHEFLDGLVSKYMKQQDMFKPMIHTRFKPARTRQNIPGTLGISIDRFIEMVNLVSDDVLQATRQEQVNLNKEFHSTVKEVKTITWKLIYGRYGVKFNRTKDIEVTQFAKDLVNFERENNYIQLL